MPGSPDGPEERSASPARRIPRRAFCKLALYGGAAALLASYPVFIERYIVLVDTYTIPVPHLPAAFAGYTIAQLTDLHYGFLVSLRFVAGVVSRANRLPCDLIVCTGDYIHQRNSTQQIDQVWPILSGLRARDGVLSILGNHDHWGDTSRSAYWLDRSGQNLRRAVRPISRGESRIWVAGAGDLWEDHLGLDDLLREVPEEDCRIVLAHNPDTADTPHSARVDLYVSGHTHGGQVNIPGVGAPVLPVQNKNYSSGRRRTKSGAPIFISRGIGWAVLPVRLNCPPEIAVLRLVPA